MESNFISGPTEFQHMEGTSVDFDRTFNLGGIGDDETLRLYLRKAGLSDEIEYLTPEQRRAFIYDIIKSNKMPGYWMPSTMKSSPTYNLPTTSSMVGPRPPPPAPTLPSSYNEPSPMLERRKEMKTTPPQTLNFATMSTSSSTGSLYSLDNTSSPIVPRRFEQVPAAPPSPSTFVTSLKGSKYEISGPMNFQHVAGDMTRDMTRNAFDLNVTPNDNVLRKYMRERGITDEDLQGMRKPDIIRNIVQSKFTWMPPKRQSSTNNASTNSMYSTLSKRSAPPPPPSGSPQMRRTVNSTVMQPPPPPPPPSLPTASATPAAKTSPPKAFIATDTTTTDSTSSYGFMSARFADPSEFPAPEVIFRNAPETEPSRLLLPPLPPQAPRPAPPPRKPKSPSNGAPPPPSLVTADNNKSSIIYHTPLVANSYGAVSGNENLYETVQDAKGRAPGPPKQAAAAVTNKDLYATTNTFPTAPVKSKAPKSSSFVPPPPPPPPLPSTADNALSLSTAHINSVRPSNTTGGPTPTPPPPPPPPQLSIAATTGTPLPPPPPPSSGNNHTGHAPSAAVAPHNNSGGGGGGDSGDPRDAFLASIRKGVTLKKVDQKAATISGVKPRAERKPQPPVNDFLSELKMGVTLRRVKNPALNPYAGDEPDESNA